MNNIIILNIPPALVNYVHTHNLRYDSNLYSDLIDNFISLTKKRYYDITGADDELTLETLTTMYKISPYITREGFEALITSVTNDLMINFMIHGFLDLTLYHIESTDIKIVFNAVKINHHKG